VVLSEKTLLFLADFDGELEMLLGHLAKRAGSVFDAVFRHVDQPPPTPIAGDPGAFVKWAMGHAVAPKAVYTAYPTGTVQKIKSLAAAAGVVGTRRRTR
jgi:hypothetical protein